MTNDFLQYISNRISELQECLDDLEEDELEDIDIDLKAKEYFQESLTAYENANEIYREYLDRK